MTETNAGNETLKVPDVKDLIINEKDAGSSANSARSLHSSGGSTPATDHASQDPAITGSEEKEGPIRTPFAHPLSSCKPQPRPNLTPDQIAKYTTVLHLVRAWTTLPVTSVKNAPSEPITEHEQMWLSRDCILRYLRASSWSTTHAVDRLKATLVWRREFGVDKLSADYISVEMETGKECIMGYDVNGRPCLHMDPGRQNTKKSERQIEAMVYMLERVIDLIPPGQETTALLINFKNATSSSSPSVGQGRQTLSILQGHYPERLGRACISDLPWYINTFFKLISPFIDPVTKTKMVFNQPLRDTHVPASQLWKDYGGDADFDYDHEQYWPALTKLCEDRRTAYKDRWIEGGKKIGEFEAYLRGGNHKPLKELADNHVEQN